MQGEARRGTTGVLLRRPCVAVRMRERSSVHSSHGRRGHQQRAARAAREGGPCATGQRMQADWPSSHVLRVRRAHHVSCCTAFPRLLLLHYLAPSTDRVPHVENGIQLGMGVFFLGLEAQSRSNPLQTLSALVSGQIAPQAPQPQPVQRGHQSWPALAPSPGSATHLPGGARLANRARRQPSADDTRPGCRSCFSSACGFSTPSAAPACHPRSRGRPLSQREGGSQTLASANG